MSGKCTDCKYARIGTDSCGFLTCIHPEYTKHSASVYIGLMFANFEHSCFEPKEKKKTEYLSYFNKETHQLEFHKPCIRDGKDLTVVNNPHLARSIIIGLTGITAVVDE